MITLVVLIVVGALIAFFIYAFREDDRDLGDHIRRDVTAVRERPLVFLKRAAMTAVIFAVVYGLIRWSGATRWSDHFDALMATVTLVVLGYELWTRRQRKRDSKTGADPQR